MLLFGGIHPFRGSPATDEAYLNGPWILREGPTALLACGAVVMMFVLIYMAMVNSLTILFVADML